MTDFSINTNASAKVALSNLTSIQKSYGAAQKQAATGYKVADATDNASVFAVAQGIRSNLASYDAITTALNDGQSTVSTAITVATDVSNIISQLTQTLSSLADGTISSAQRTTYTKSLFTQVNDIRNLLEQPFGAAGNLLVGYTGTTSNPFPSDGFTVFASGTILNIVSGLGGNQLSVTPQQLQGGSNGTDGWLGLARLIYYVGTDTNGVTAAANDTYSTAYLGYGNQGILASRTQISQNEALAALDPVSLSLSAYIPTTGSSGVPSVFGSAIANFQAQVNQALGSLGADYNNIGTQITFVQSLSGASTAALGNLVDANLAQTSAKLTALQTQQQLAIQSLSVANAQPKVLLSLFEKAAA